MLIATRQLRARISSEDVTVEVRLYKPINNEGMWVCDYEIDWPDGTKKNYGAGADSIQSIVLALQNIGVQLYTSKYHGSGQLAWDVPGNGYGFPLAKSVRDLYIGDDLDL